MQDLNSANGTLLNGVALTPNNIVAVPVNGEVQLGSIIIKLIGNATSAQPPSPAVKSAPASPSHSAPEKSAQNNLKDTNLDEFGKEKIPLLTISGIPDSARPLIQEIKKHAHVELLKRLNLKKLAVAGASEASLEQKARETIKEIVAQLNIQLPANIKKETLEQELLHEAIGLGPLEYLLSVDTITEIMVNGPDQVYVEKGGVLYRTDTAFADNNQVLSAIERIVAPLGRRIDESSPMVDARLADGSRVNAVIPPLSLIGPTITIRKFSKKPLQAKDLINFGSISPNIVKFLDICIKLRKNIIISGGTGSGKTTLLNVLSSFLPNRERIITIEDAAELQLHQEHLVRLESRPPNVEGKGEINIRDLVRNSLRMRPDRIVIGECRGGEALDMLQAMNTGHDGSLTTIHANTPRDALARLETLVMMAGFDLPLKAIREQISSAIHIVVQISRERDGSRKVTHISEITKMEGDIITMQDIFLYRHDGWTEDGKMVGKHVATGAVPSFVEDIERAKLPLDIGIFSPGSEE
ncbi:MAG: CpaF family protein [Lentisphaeria bacterium]|nr:CpaF family protein [Lentisphaeria bacterium]